MISLGTVEYHKEVESMANDFNVPRREMNRYRYIDPPVQEEQTDTDDAPSNDKHSHHYKDVKECKFLHLIEIRKTYTTRDYIG